MKYAPEQFRMQQVGNQNNNAIAGVLAAINKLGSRGADNEKRGLELQMLELRKQNLINSGKNDAARMALAGEKFKWEKNKYEKEQNKEKQTDLDLLSALKTSSTSLSNTSGLNLSHDVDTDVKDPTKDKDIYDTDTINKELIALNDAKQLGFGNVKALSANEKKKLAEYDALKTIDDEVQRAEERKRLNGIYFNHNKNITDADTDWGVKDALTPDSFMGAVGEGAGVGALTGGAIGLIGGPTALPAAGAGALYGGVAGGTAYLTDKVMDFFDERNEDPVEKVKRLQLEKAQKSANTARTRTRNEESIFALQNLRNKKKTADGVRKQNSSIQKKIDDVMSKNKTVKLGTKNKKVTILDAPGTANQKIDNIYNKEVQQIANDGSLNPRARIAAIKQLNTQRQNDKVAYDSKYKTFMDNRGKQDKRDFELYKMELKNKYDKELAQLKEFAKLNRPLTKKEKLEEEKLRESTKLIRLKQKKIQSDIDG